MSILQIDLLDILANRLLILVGMMTNSFMA